MRGFDSSGIHRPPVSYLLLGRVVAAQKERWQLMQDDTVRVALYVLGIIGALSVVCIGVLIAVLPSPDVAALAVLSSIASAAVGGVAGMITPRQQGPAAPPGPGDTETGRTSEREGRAGDAQR